MDDKLDQVSTRFGKLLKKETEKRTSKSSHELLFEEHMDAIRGLRTLGASFSMIAAQLSEAGLKTTSLQVKKFCISAFAEVPLKRKKRRKRSSKPAVPVRNTRTEEKPTLKTTGAKLATKQSKPGFRVPKDEDL